MNETLQHLIDDTRKKFGLDDYRLKTTSITEM